MTKKYTWDEIKELGKSIHEKDSDVYLMTADADMLNRLYVQPYLAQITGKPLIDEETYTMTLQRQTRQQHSGILKNYIQPIR